MVRSNRGPKKPQGSFATVRHQAARFDFGYVHSPSPLRLSAGYLSKHIASKGSASLVSHAVGRVH